MNRPLIAVLLCAVAASAHARDAAGRLDAILAPNNAQPAIVVKGGAFDVFLRSDAQIHLESAAGSFPLPAGAALDWRGRRKVRVTIPATVPAGAYTLAAQSPGGAADRNFRAVYVLDGPPDEYRIAVWSNLRIGADPTAPDTAHFRTTAAINEHPPALVLVTGDLTVGGTPEQFRLALELLNDCTVPTLVAPGRADAVAGSLADYLGPYPVAIPCGADAFLLSAAPGLDWNANAGRLYVERRQVRAARWSIGVGFGLDADDLRTQLTVLVDDPLDAILGATRGSTGRTSPWGATRIFQAPDSRGALEWFNVSIRPIAPETKAPAQ